MEERSWIERKSNEVLRTAQKKRSLLKIIEIRRRQMFENQIRHHKRIIKGRGRGCKG